VRPNVGLAIDHKFCSWASARATNHVRFRIPRMSGLESSRRKSLAARFTKFRKCRTTAEESPRRDARFKGCLGIGPPLRRRYVTPSMCIRCSEAGTREMPSPTETRLSVDAMREASGPMRGVKPAAWQAAIVEAYNPRWMMNVSPARAFRRSAFRVGPGAASRAAKKDRQDSTSRPDMRPRLR